MPKTVMIVEDNELNMKLFNDLLESRGYNIIQTRNGMDALGLARAARHHPTVNSSLDGTGENLLVHRSVHLGIAVDTDDGLVVPVIRDADRKGIWALAAEAAALAEKARARKLAPAHLQGGTFSVTSLGAQGGTGFTPIINAPEFPEIAIPVAGTLLILLGFVRRRRRTA